MNFKFKTLPFFSNTKLDYKIKNLSSLRNLANYRNWKINFDNNDFEIFIGEIISSQLPINFLEGFDTLNHELSKNFWPTKPKFILTSNLFYDNDLFNLYVLKKCREFSLCKSIIGQQISVAAANSVFLKFTKLQFQINFLPGVGPVISTII